MKAIMLPLTRESDTSFLSTIAANLAIRFSATITGLFIRRDPKHAMPLLGEGLTAEMIQEMCDATEREGLKYAGEANKLFSDAMNQQAVVSDETAPGPKALWRTIAGDVADHVGRCARTADFAVCERPQGKNSAQADIFNDLVFRSGRSVLMVPNSHEGPILDNVLVAWNGRAECARAVGAALPLLKKARKVTLLQIGELAEELPTLDDIARYLDAHGIACEKMLEAKPEGSVGETVHARAKAVGADTIVIGAFSTARWRELILGGVTRHLIESSELPIYMSH